MPAKRAREVSDNPPDASTTPPIVDADAIAPRTRARGHAALDKIDDKAGEVSRARKKQKKTVLYSAPSLVTRSHRVVHADRRSNRSGERAEFRPSHGRRHPRDARRSRSPGHSAPNQH